MNATSVPDVGLDSDELLHLAIKASEASDHDAAITYLKRAIALSPDSAGAYYMLGAEHAEIGMFDRAVEDMQHAVDLGIDLPAAHFQLGLLHITSGRVQDAVSAWEPLDALAPNDPLYLFKTGMIHLANDEFAACASALQKGIDANTENDALNRDMLGVLEQVRPLVEQQGPSQAPAAPVSERSAQHILLSAYRQEPDNEADNQ